MKICGVYRFSHCPTGRCYVGSSKDCNFRIRCHIAGSNKSNPGCFPKFLKEFGIENFSHEILETCHPDDRLAREKFWIEKLNSVYPFGFNIQRDPTKLWDYSYNDAARAKISAANKGKKLSPEHAKKLSQINAGNKHALGYVHSDEARAKISASSKVRKHSPETRAKISASQVGRKHNMESRIKMSNSQIGNRNAAGNKNFLGRTHSAETRAKISKSQEGNRKCLGKKNCLGHFHTDETRAKMSASHKRRIELRKGANL